MTSNSMLEIFCFRGLHAKVEGQEISAFRTVRTQALLAYLAVEQESPNFRERLAGLLWPDEPESNARRSLSQTLLYLRQSLRDRERVPSLLRTSPQTIELNPEVHPWVDVIQFKRHLANVRQHAHEPFTACPACVEELAQAIDLYRGPFLDGFSVPKSDLFEMWLATQREHLQQQALDAMAQLSALYEANHAYEEAQQVLRRLLALVPEQEEAHAQLMRVLALSGQRSRAIAQYESCCHILMDGLGVEPSDETVALYAQIRDGVLERHVEERRHRRMAEVATEREQVTSLPSSVPYQATVPPPHFVGREAELELLRASVNLSKQERAGLQVIALVGMGGVGKTTLAAQAAHLLRTHFQDGVLWANAANSLPIDILAAWARAYDYDFSNLPDLESRAAALRGMLAEKRALIIIDNVVSAAHVRPLLPSSTHCMVLLTMRDLDIAHALNAQVLMLSELSADKGRQLLIQILDAERVVAEERAAKKICTLLQNLPLAVEIVAQRLKSRPRQRLRAMAERLQHEHYRLGLEISDQAVRTSFEVSWMALDESLQRLFALLALFGGRPFGVDAVAAIAEMDAFEVEDDLYALEALSLLKSEGDIHFQQHPLLADFAQEKLSEPENAVARMTAYYFDFVTDHHQDIESMVPERDNIIAAVEMAYDQEQWQLLIDYADLLMPVGLQRGLFSEASRLCERVHVATQKLDNPLRQARNLLIWGQVYHREGRYTEANKHLVESLNLYEAMGEKSKVADVQECLAHLALDQGQFAEAKLLIGTCLSYRQELEQTIGIADAYYFQANLYYYEEALDEANQMALKSLALQKECKHVKGQLSLLRLLAHIENRRQAYDRAQRYAERAMILSKEGHDLFELANTLYALTTVHRHRKNFEAAYATAEEGLDLLRRMGLRRLEGQILYQMSVIQNELGNRDPALSFCQQSIEIFRELHNHLSCAYSLRHLGDLYQNQGQLEQAKGTWEEAQSLGYMINHSALLASLDKRLGTNFE